jgi:two-component system response regulator PilR (NtrC family)
VAEANILVVDDELSMREFLEILLRRAGYAVTTAATGEDGLARLTADRYDLLLTDLNLPGINGIELMRQLRTSRVSTPQDTPVILITAFGTTESAVKAMKEGATDYVLKPFNNDELLINIRKALGHQALQAENIALRRELQAKHWFGNLVGNSEAMQRVYERIQRVKDAPINCLILGESGTGKEMVARAIHYSGFRKDGPFIAVNCGAISENLIESELFGYKKGAFTGAVQDRPGYFQAANGGTIFLDEVGDMPLHTQVKVLRAIAERRIVPVGGFQEVPIDVRILAATNKSLRQEVAEGRFREDLFYRLDVVSMNLPSLRDRGDDVELLARTFLERYSREFGKNVRGIGPEAMAMIRSYGWPGNVRELQNAIELAVAMEQGGLITPDALPQSVRERWETTFSSSPSARDLELPPEGVDLDAILANLEQRYLQMALDLTEGRKTQAAKLLGLSFRSFRYRLAKYHMDDES